MIVSGFISEYKNKTLDDRISILVINTPEIKRRQVFALRDNGKEIEKINLKSHVTYESPSLEGLEDFCEAIRDSGYDSIYRNSTYNQDVSKQKGLDALIDLIRIGTNDEIVIHTLVQAVTGSQELDLKEDPSERYGNFGAWS